MSSLRNKQKRTLRRSLADAEFGVTGPTVRAGARVRLPTTGATTYASTYSPTAAKPTGAATSVSAYTPTAVKPPVITAVIGPAPKPVITAVVAPKTVDRGVYAPVPYEAPAAAYIPPSAPEPEPVQWAPPQTSAFVPPVLTKGTESLPPPPSAPAPKKLGIIARILAFFGFVKAPEAKISGDSPMTRIEAAGSLVRRARQGDQNAMAVIDMARQNAAQGNVQAKLAVGCIKKYIEAHPVGPTSFAGEDPRRVSQRLRLLARRDIPISRIDPMLAWELGE